MALLVLTLILLAAAYQVPYERHIAVGGDDAPYVRGFWLPERTDERTWRWSKGTSELVLHNAGQLAPAATLALKFSGYRPLDQDPAHVVIRVNGQTLTDFTASGDWQVESFDLDASKAGNGDWVVTLETNPWRAENDRRALGLAVEWLELSSRAPALPPLWTTLLAGSTVLLVWLLAGQWREGWTALGVAVGAALLIGLGAALAREWTAYVLPIVTVSLLLALAMLAAQPWWTRHCRAVQARRPWLALGGLGIILAALFGIRAGIALPAALGAIALSCVALAAAQLPLAVPAAPRIRREYVALALVFLLGLFMRLYALDQIPFGIFRDEARHGLTALRILNDSAYRPVFIGPPISQPTPYFYLLAGTFQLLGANLFSLRLVSALAGALAMPCLWLLVRELFGARAALLATFGLAVSSWHTSISRFAMPYAEPTLLALLGYFFLWRGLGGRGWRDYALAGVTLALAQYAAQTSRALLLVAVALAMDELVTRWRRGELAELRRVIGGLAIACILGLMVLLPLMAYVVRNPEPFFARTDQVALWSAPYNEGDYLPSLLAANSLVYAGAFHLAGDPNGRHHFPGAPLLDVVLGAFLLAGLVIVGQNLRRGTARFAVYWFVSSLAPGILTADAPSALRVIEAAPAAYTLAALGMDGMWRATQRVRVTFPALGFAVAGLLLCAALGLNVHLYFYRMVDSPQVWRKFAPIATRAGATLNELAQRGELPAKSRVYVPAAMLDSTDDLTILQFLTQNRFRFRPLDELPAPRKRRALAVLLPRYDAYWQLVAEEEPRYAARADDAARELETWQRRAHDVSANARRVRGPNFPASKLPTFELWIVR